MWYQVPEPGLKQTHFLKEAILPWEGLEKSIWFFIIIIINAFHFVNEIAMKMEWREK